MEKIAMGINIGQDQGAAIVQGGKLIAAIAQERIDRIKHSSSVNLPFLAIDALLKYCEISIHDIDCFGVSSTAVDINDLTTYVSDALKNRYKLNTVNVIPVPHHQSHAASAFYTSDFTEAIALVADGGGEMIGLSEEAESIFYCNKSSIRLLEHRLQSNYFHALYRPHNYLFPFMNKEQLNDQISLGKKYEQITNLLGFGKNGAGKTMGLSAYGKNLIDSTASPIGNTFSFNLKFQHILQQYYSMYEQSGDNYFVFMDKHKADIARSVQDYTENQVLEIIAYLIKKYHTTQICLAGGIFLNCPINHKIIERFPEVSLHICPAAGDDGQAIGAAFVAALTLMSQITPNSSDLPYLGINYSSSQIEDAFHARGIPYHHYSDEQIASLVAKEIYSNQIVGLLHGRSEIGPRALCHRSILANPTNPNIKDYINSKVKHRESFRPFAPVVVAESQYVYFALLQESPYMLLAADVRNEFRKQLPGITHIDGSARVQSVRQTDDPYVHKILTEFKQLSGFPILLNTSFNDCGEPIVESPDDALRTFLTTEIDILVIENYIAYKRDITL